MLGNIHPVFHLIFLLICVTKCEYSLSYSVENLYAILDQTSEYFKNLSNAYEASNIDVSNNIDSVITKYVENTTEAILHRQKRSVQDNLQPSKGVKVLQGFVETLSIGLPDFQDIAFIFVQDEQRLLSLAAAVDSSKILLYQLVDNATQLVGTYSQFNGKRIVVNSYNNGVLMVVQGNTDEIVVLHLSKNENGIYELYFKQELEIPGALHMNMWLGMNQLYLGIASDTKVFIYVWLGEHFDKIDTFYFGARKLLPFQNKNLMHIVVVGSLTRILRFSVRSNKFVEIQKLRGARDVGSFHFKDGHFEERFLVLADDSSMIFYKEMYDRFSPFQRVASTGQVHPLTMENTVVLLFADENAAEVYQYNGWRFIKLHTVLSNIRQIRQIHSYGEDTLVVQGQDREWKFLGPVWTVKKTWQTSQNEIQAWCSETKQKISQRTLEKLPRLKDPVRIPNAHIGQLRAQNINGQNATELIRLTRQYKKTIDKLNLAKSILTRETTAERSKYTVLHGKRLTVKCKTKCHVRHLYTDTEIKPAAKSKRLESTDRTLEFASLKVKELNNWKCPVPNVKVDDISVKGTVNGILMQDLLEGTLKVSGDQEISGEHTFTNLYATNVSMPLNIATNSTKQTILMREARVKELYLTEDEFFLPLNGTTVTMNGSIRATKVKVTGPVELRDGLKGEALEKLALLKDISTPLTLPKDCFLQNVTFRNLVKAKDIVRPRGLSLKGILENSIPLDSNVPQHLILSSDKTQWNNVTLWGYKNWVTKNSAETVMISGAKFASNISLTNASYANLPTPKLTVPLCAMEVITQEVKTSSITMDTLVVKNLSVAQVFGANNLNNIIFDSVSALQSVDFSTKRFTGQVYIKNISALEIKGTDIRDLKIQMDDWIDVNCLKGPINIAKLVVNDLETPAVFNLSLPRKVKNVIVKADSDIANINDINMLSFMENVLKVDDVISLEEVTFTHGFTSNQVYASGATLNFSHLDTHPNLRSKRISGNLKTDTISVPQTFGYVADDKPSTFMIHGTVRFLQEPTVRNIKEVNLKKLSEDLWMSNQDTVLSGSMNFENITLKADVTIYDPEGSMNSLNTKMWLNLSDRLLSKTKEQNITVASSFKNVEMPAIIAAKDSILQSSDSNLDTLLNNSLMRNRTQIVDAVWHFEELHIDNLNWDGKLNGIDLNTDIVRHDAEQNIITGKKTITNLMTKNLWSHNKSFSNWASNAVTQRCRKLFTIKGRKTFKNIVLNNLSVKGTIMGRNVEEALLKSGNQTVYGARTIRGHLNVSSLITDSTVNDVNLMNLINDQVKKHKARQTIESEIDFKNNLEVFGKITIDGRYEGTDLININDHNRLDAVLNRTTEVMELVEDIRTVLDNRAIYVSKFEEVDETTLETTLNPDTEDVIVFNSTCLCESANISMHCNDTKLLNILAGTNSSTLLILKLVLLDDAVFVVIVSSDYVSIYIYATTEEEFYQRAGLYVPDIHQASVESADNSLWIVLGLSDETLILRYQVWNEFVHYVLPASDTFVTSTTPNNQHLLIRSDGVWSLAGVLHPQHIFKMPLNGKIKAFALGADYYIKTTTENSTAVFKARYVGN